MDFTKLKLFNMMKGKMMYHGQRQAVLAGNVANANTPGYIPKDIKKPDFGKMAANYAGGTTLSTTHPGHMSGTGGGRKFAGETQRSFFEMTPVGNAVSLEEQMMKISENSMDYQTTVGMYKKMMDMMRIAGGGDR